MMDAMAHSGTGLIPEAERTVDALRAAGARFAFVHGSRAADTAHGGSDTDLAAWFDRHDPAPWTIGGLPAGVDLLVPDRAPLELAGRVALRAPLR
jgi:predicted nucleotidyltransferase